MLVIIIIGVVVWLPISIVLELTNNYRYKR